MKRVQQDCKYPHRLLSCQNPVSKLVTSHSARDYGSCAFFKDTDANIHWLQFCQQK